MPGTGGDARDAARPVTAIEVGRPHANGDAPDGFTAAVERFRSRWFDEPQRMTIEPPAALVDGMLLTNRVAVLYGPPKSGKSFVAPPPAESPLAGCDAGPEYQEFRDLTRVDAAGGYAGPHPSAPGRRHGP